MEAVRRKVVLLKSQRQSKTRPAIVLDLESMWNSPSLRGMLSFLEVSPEERRQMLELRQTRDAQSGYVVSGLGSGSAEEQNQESIPQASAVQNVIPTENSEGSLGVAKDQKSDFSRAGERPTLPIASAVPAAPANLPDVEDKSGIKAIVRNHQRVTPKRGTLPRQQVVPSDSWSANPVMESEAGFASSAIIEQQDAARQDTPKQGTFIEVPTEDSSAIRIGSDADFDLWSLAELGRVLTSPELRPMVLAQDVHTPGEELLYGKMWSRARPVEGKSFRILTIGIKKLTAMVGLSKTDNCKNNLQGLVRKLAIDDLGVAPNPNHGHVYRIWDQGAILQRRRERGLTHYFRVRRAVILVNPNTPDISPSPESSGWLKQGTPFNFPGDPIEKPPPRKSGYVQTGSKIDTMYSKEIVHPVTAPQSIVQALLDVMGDCDDDSANRIVAAANNGRPAIPEAVIVQIIQMKGPRIRKSANVAYPLRVLEKAVLETASGVTGANLCKAWEHAEKIREEDERRRRLEEEATARAILADPSNWPDQGGYWLKWANQILSKSKEQESQSQTRAC
jgi:hypothetical protein